MWQYQHTVYGMVPSLQRLACAWISPALDALVLVLAILVNIVFFLINEKRIAKIAPLQCSALFLMIVNK